MSSGVKVSKLNFELNPRGNLWFNDESTFGHKLLSKMGWSKGKGLGRNEDGIKENIKIAKKETNTGVGWNHDEIPVAVGCLEYENILQNLQKHFNNREKSSSDEAFEKSLEQRSRSARNHLHYQKFVRGKDLMRYSEKDMKSIFLEKPKKPVSDHPSRPPQEAPTFNSQLSINDYFALKMQKKKDEAAKLEAKVTTENGISSEALSRKPPKKHKFVSDNPETRESATTEKDVSFHSQPISEKPSKKRKFVSESPKPKESFTTVSGGSSQPVNKKPYKKQKFVSESPETKESFATENSNSSQSQTVNKKPHKKQKFVSESPETKKSFATENSDSSHSQPVNEKPYKKQKFVSESLETQAEVTTDNGISFHSQPVKEKPSKKRKCVSESSEAETSKSKKRSSNYKTCDSSSVKEDSVADQSSESDETRKTKKKKKKKSKKDKSRLQQLKSCLKSRGNYDFEKTRNVSFNEQVSFRILDTSLESCEEINDLVDDEPTVEEGAWEDEQCPADCSFIEEPENEMQNEQNGECCPAKEEDSVTNENGVSEEEGECGAEETPPCFDLPKSSGSNFDFWLESQRQATKMKLYKEMAKKIRKNKILRSTNLLDIKGYGNWSL